MEYKQPTKSPYVKFKNQIIKIQNELPLNIATFIINLTKMEINMAKILKMAQFVKRHKRDRSGKPWRVLKEVWSFHSISLCYQFWKIYQILSKIWKSVTWILRIRIWFEILARAKSADTWKSLDLTKTCPESLEPKVPQSDQSK